VTTHARTQETREAIEEARAAGRAEPRSAVSVAGKANVGAAVLAHAIRQIRFLEHKKQRQRLLEDGYGDESTSIRRASVRGVHMPDDWFHRCQSTLIIVLLVLTMRRRDIDEYRRTRQQRLNVFEKVRTSQDRAAAAAAYVEIGTVTVLSRDAFGRCCHCSSPRA
jgi:hypothetical protein